MEPGGKGREGKKRRSVNVKVAIYSEGSWNSGVARLIYAR